MLKKYKLANLTLVVSCLLGLSVLWAPAAWAAPKGSCQFQEFAGGSKLDETTSPCTNDDYKTIRGNVRGITVDNQANFCYRIIQRAVNGGSIQVQKVECSSLTLTDGSDGTGDNQDSCNVDNPPASCTTDPATDCSTAKGGKCDFIGKYINPAINTLTVIFGLLATISIILGAINYATSEGDPQKASKAKRRIANTVIAIVAYLFLYAFLQFIVPGGIFH